ncbi:MAG: UDP-3-O-(3-hydroxymyristoyl)glucosamine N-acyltransferase [Candidatus Rhabdochlamydia sp.]
MKKFTLQEIADLTESTLVGNPNHLISSVDSLDNAGSEDASFLANPLYRTSMNLSKAGVICIENTFPLEEGKNFLLSDNPSITFQKIIKILLLPQNSSGFKGIHSSAVIHESAEIGQNVQIGPSVVIDKNTKIGDGCIIYPFTFIGPNSCIGENCIIYSNVTIREKTILGNRVILQPGVVIGSCGFGYTTDQKGQHSKLEQLGSVIIEDDVEIGANAAIDRARFKVTKIGKGTKIDNLVQIAHNVSIGSNNIVVSQTGIAGSVKTGESVMFGGQVGVVGHVEIASNVMIATRGGVSKSIDKPGKYGGSPVMPLPKYNREQARVRKIPKYLAQIVELKQRVEELEKIALKGL